LSVFPSDIVVYGSASMPEADSATVGGLVDTTKTVAWYDLSANDTIDAVSSSASDTACNVKIMARDATGVVQTTGNTSLNGTTPVVNVGSLGTVERLLAAVIKGGAIAGLTDPGGTTGAVGDVAVYRHTAVISAHTAQTGSANSTGITPALIKLQASDGAAVSAGQIIRITNNTPAGVNNQLRQIIATTGYGTDVVAVNRDWGTVPDNTTTYNVYQGMLFAILPNPVKAITRCFATAAADTPTGSTRTFYEKVFVVNNNTATALTSAQIEIASDTPSLPGSAALDFALCTALNDSATATNRQTTPTGIGSFQVQPLFTSVPAPGNLPSGVAPNASGAQGVWLRLTLPAGTAPYKGSADLRTTGNTT
jgi:hypothetical protein